ncbi:hypothetical protein [Clostridium sp.]|uniref:hypothetical protein n=1 Tax=Clostridium sp. TaxID=1506 RepID=UPI00284A56E7|nr:hypothetical protein [Clostridium sp.]MDR3596793.1 hypothetical protein [Clostridium sp.]
MKKQGSILIEVVASIMILSLTTAFVVTTYIQSSNILKNRILHEEVERSVCNLIKELKYNISKDEIETLLSNGTIGFKYDSGFSKKLINIPITELEQGTDIEISKVAEDSMGLKLKIIANIQSSRSSALVEKEFIKSWWMDEV